MATLPKHEWLPAYQYLNPGVDDSTLIQAFTNRVGPLDDPTLPTLQDWLPAAEELNPTKTRGELTYLWDQKFGRYGARREGAPESDFKRGMQAGWHGLKHTGFGAVAAGSMLAQRAWGESDTLKNVQNWALRGMRDESAEMQWLRKEGVDDFDKVVKGVMDGDLGLAADFVQYALGYSGVNIASFAITGFGAGGVARIGAATLAKNYVKSAAKRRAAQMALTSKEPMEELLKKASKEVTKDIVRWAQHGALMTQAIGQESGEILGDLTERSVEERRKLTNEELLRGAAASLAAGMTEFVGDRTGLNLIMGKSGVKNVFTQAKGLKGRLARGVGVGVYGGAVESGTEFTQTLIEQAGKGDFPVFSDENITAAINAGAIGFVGGKTVGVVSGLTYKPILQAEDVDEAIAQAQKIVSGEQSKTSVEIDGKRGTTQEQKLEAQLASVKKQVQAAKANVQGQVPVNELNAMMGDLIDQAVDRGQVTDEATGLPALPTPPQVQPQIQGPQQPIQGPQPQTAQAQLTPQEQALQQQFAQPQAQAEVGAGAPIAQGQAAATSGVALPESQPQSNLTPAEQALAQGVPQPQAQPTAGPAATEPAAIDPTASQLAQPQDEGVPVEVSPGPARPDPYATSTRELPAAAAVELKQRAKKMLNDLEKAGRGKPKAAWYDRAIKMTGQPRGRRLIKEKLQEIAEGKDRGDGNDSWLREVMMNDASFTESEFMPKTDADIQALIDDEIALRDEQPAPARQAQAREPGPLPVDNDTDKKVRSWPWWKETGYFRQYLKNQQGLHPEKDVHDIAAQWLINQQSKDGYEHAVVIDQDTGEVILAGTSRLEHTAELNAMSKLLTTGKRRAVMHHNHPRSVPLSPGDVVASLQVGLDIITVVAHTKEGNISSATRTPIGTATTVQEAGGLTGLYMDVYDKISDVVAKAFGDIDAHAVTHQIMLETLHKHGLIVHRTNWDIKASLWDNEKLASKTMNEARKAGDKVITDLLGEEGNETKRRIHRPAKPLRKSGGLGQALGTSQEIQGEEQGTGPPAGQATGVGQDDTQKAPRTKAGTRKPKPKKKPPITLKNFGVDTGNGTVGNEQAPIRATMKVLAPLMNEQDTSINRPTIESRFIAKIEKEKKQALKDGNIAVVHHKELAIKIINKALDDANAYGKKRVSVNKFLDAVQQQLFFVVEAKANEPRGSRSHNLEGEAQDLVMPFETLDQERQLYGSGHHDGDSYIRMEFSDDFKVVEFVNWQSGFGHVKSNRDSDMIGLITDRNDIVDDKGGRVSSYEINYRVHGGNRKGLDALFSVTTKNEEGTGHQSDYLIIGFEREKLDAEHIKGQILKAFERQAEEDGTVPRKATYGNDRVLTIISNRMARTLYEQRKEIDKLDEQMAIEGNMRRQWAELSAQAGIKEAKKLGVEWVGLPQEAEVRRIQWGQRNIPKRGNVWLPEDDDLINEYVEAEDDYAYIHGNVGEEVYIGKADEYATIVNNNYDEFLAVHHSLTGRRNVNNVLTLLVEKYLSLSAKAYKEIDLKADSLTNKEVIEVYRDGTWGVRNRVGRYPFFAPNDDMDSVAARIWTTGDPHDEAVSWEDGGDTIFIEPIEHDGDEGYSHYKVFGATHFGARGTHEGHSGVLTMHGVYEKARLAWNAEWGVNGLRRDEEHEGVISLYEKGGLYPNTLGRLLKHKGYTGKEASKMGLVHPDRGKGWLWFDIRGYEPPDHQIILFNVNEESSASQEVKLQRKEAGDKLSMNDGKRTFGAKDAPVKATMKILSPLLAERGEPINRPTIESRFIAKLEKERKQAEKSGDDATANNKALAIDIIKRTMDKLGMEGKKKAAVNDFLHEVSNELFRVISTHETPPRGGVSRRLRDQVFDLVIPFERVKDGVTQTIAGEGHHSGNSYIRMEIEGGVAEWSNWQSGLGHGGGRDIIWSHPHTIQVGKNQEEEIRIFPHYDASQPHQKSKVTMIVHSGQSGDQGYIRQEFEATQGMTQDDWVKELKKSDFGHYPGRFAEKDLKDIAEAIFPIATDTRDKATMGYNLRRQWADIAAVEGIREVKQRGVKWIGLPQESEVARIQWNVEKGMEELPDVDVMIEQYVSGTPYEYVIAQRGEEVTVYDGRNEDNAYVIESYAERFLAVSDEWVGEDQTAAKLDEDIEAKYFDEFGRDNEWWNDKIMEFREAYQRVANGRDGEVAYIEDDKTFEIKFTTDLGNRPRSSYIENPGTDDMKFDSIGHAYMVLRKMPGVNEAYLVWKENEADGTEYYDSSERGSRVRYADYFIDDARENWVNDTGENVYDPDRISENVVNMYKKGGFYPNTLGRILKQKGYSAKEAVLKGMNHPQDGRGWLWFNAEEYTPPETNIILFNVGHEGLHHSAVEESPGTPPAGAEPNYNLHEEPGWWDNVLRRFQDDFIDLKRVVDALKETGKKLADAINPVYLQELFHGRVASHTKQFINEEVIPLLETMQRYSVTKEELSEYLHARHVLHDKVNAKLQKLNPNLENNDALSGMTNDEALKILAKATPQLEELAKRIDAMTKGTRDTMVEYGLESDETIQKWEDTYQYYVPLYRDKKVNSRNTGRGRGYSASGSTVKGRLGSENTEVLNIVASVIKDRNDAIVRGEKMRPVIAMAAMLIKFPDANIAKLVRKTEIEYVDDETGLTMTASTEKGETGIRTRKVFDKKTQTVKHIADRNYQDQDNAVSFRVKGKNYVLIFNEENKRALEISKSFNSVDVETIGAVARAVYPVTRWLASVNTQYNPLFGVTNFGRDLLFAALSMTNGKLAGSQKEALVLAFKHMVGIFKEARAQRKGMHTQTETGELWKRFNMAGGTTGYRDLFRLPGRQAEEIETLLNPDTFQKAWKGTGGSALAQLLSDYNLMMENSIRLGSFKAALDKGMSDTEAAYIAKNITVNFNKKGRMTSQIGAFYAFFNVSVQGTKLIFDVLFDTDVNGKLIGVSKKGKVIIGAGITLGAMQAVMLNLAGIDEEDVPEWLLARNFVIPMPGTDKGYVMYPMPLGFNVLPNIGRAAMESVMYGNPAKQVGQMATDFFDVFSPVGGSGSFSQFIAPTAFDPIVSIGENRDWAGRQIAQEDFSSLDPTPGHTRAKDTATHWAYGLSQLMNYATLGTEYQPGAISPSPDQIDYLIKQVTGGVGRELSKASSTIGAMVEGSDLPTYKVPLIGRFVGSASGDAATRNIFYANMEVLNGIRREIRGRQKDRKPLDVYYRDEPLARYAETAAGIYQTIKKLRSTRREMEARGSTQSLVGIDKQITALMKRVNDRVKQLKEAA